MKGIKDIWLKIKDKLFAFALILLGLILAVKGFSVNESIGLSQTSGFKIASIVLIILGLLSLYFVINKKYSKVFMTVINIVLLLGIVFFVYLNFFSISDTIDYNNAVETSEKLAIQGLDDIQKIAKAYDMKYQKNPESLEDIIKFAKFDSITKLTRAVGDIPVRRMSMEEAKKLNLRFGTATISEEHAIKLGLIIREYKKVPVYTDLFSPEKLKRAKREYDFDINKLSSYRTLDAETDTVVDTEKKFAFKKTVVDSVVCIKIMAYPPYGPQVISQIRDTYHFGSLYEKSLETSW